jgi:DNA-binding beta-propeller fold protein YncE
VLVVDAVNNTVIDSIWTGNNTTDVLMHPTADRVYVTNVYSSSLTVIRDGVGIVEHPGRPVTTRGLPMPTVVRGVLFLPEASSHKLQAASLLDVAGRKVLDLKAGANDVSRLAPGVYFVRQEPQASSHKLQAVDKVIITR